MSGENEHEHGNAGDEPSPEAAEFSAGAGSTPDTGDEDPEIRRISNEALQPPVIEPAYHRPFRSWASAKETKPSIFQRLGSLFRSKPKDEEIDPAELLQSNEDPVEVQEESPYSGDVGESVAEIVANRGDEQFDEPVVDEPVVDEPVIDEPVVDEPVVDEPEVEARRISRFGGDFFEAPTEIIPEPGPPKPGFFARLFGRKPKVVPAPAQPEPEIAPMLADDEPVIATNEYPAEVEETSDLEKSEIEAAFEDATEPVQEVAAEPMAEPSTEPLFESNAEQPLEFIAGTETPFESVDDALPAAELPHEPSLAELQEAITEPIEPVTPKPKRPSLLARLFGRTQPAPEPRKERPSLELEIHEDRIAAAADALDEMEKAVEPAAHDAFSSVEDALPEPMGDERFAPPPPPAESRPTVETSRDTRPTVETTKETRPTVEVEPDVRPTIEVEKDTRSTVEMDFGKTMDIVPDQTFEDTLELHKKKDMPSRSELHLMFGETMEVVDEKRRADADSGAYFGDTLEPSHFGDITPAAEELDKDTDEFAVPILTSSETPAVVPDLDEDTAQVSRKSLIEKLLFWRKEQEQARPLDAASTIVEGNPVFLFSKFRTFYNEIIRHKHQKTEFTAGFSTAIVTDYAADLSPEGAADALSKNLAAMLELQAAEATWMGGESALRYPDAQYAMAALADETFLHQEWEGQGAWPRHLLEVKLFKSRSADVELFKRIDKLLKEQPNSAAARDLARVYLMVLAAGFKGKYRPFGLTRPLAEYRQRLYEYIHHGGDALMIYAPDRRIFPEATQRTLVGHAIGKYSSAQRWAAILVFLVLGYTAIAHFAWSRVSADLKDVTGRIITTTSANGNGGP